LPDSDFKENNLKKGENIAGLLGKPVLDTTADRGYRKVNGKFVVSVENIELIFKGVPYSSLEVRNEIRCCLWKFWKNRQVGTI